MRLQPDADDGDRARGSQRQRPDQLTGEDCRGLTLALAFPTDPLEGIAQMQNDLGAAVRKDRLHIGTLARVALERPHAMDDRSQLWPTPRTPSISHEAV